MFKINNYSSIKSEEELAKGVLKAYDWAIKKGGGSGTQLGRLFLWGYNPGKYPNGTGFGSLDGDRIEWAMDLIMYCAQYGEPHYAFPADIRDHNMEQLISEYGTE